jgi:hypothetical protein
VLEIGLVDLKTKFKVAGGLFMHGVQKENTIKYIKQASRSV